MKKVLLAVLALTLLTFAAPVAAATTKKASATVKKVVVTKKIDKKTTSKKVVKKDADVVTGSSIPGAPAGYMKLLISARNAYLRDSALAKKHRSAKELAAAEEAYAKALDEANALLTPVVISNAASTNTEANIPSATSTQS